MSELSLTSSDAPLESEEERVISWRTEALERAGYGDVDAITLALRPDVDLHRAIDLVRNGCPTETAVRILL